MHPARLSLLAIKHKQWRAITSRHRDDTGATRITLECGHDTSIAPHFDMSHTRECGCIECGEQYVRSAPQYAKEFEAQ